MKLNFYNCDISNIMGKLSSILKRNWIESTWHEKTDVKLKFNYLYNSFICSKRYNH